MIFAEGHLHGDYPFCLIWRDGVVEAASVSAGAETGIFAKPVELVMSSLLRREAGKALFAENL